MLKNAIGASGFVWLVLLCFGALSLWLLHRQHTTAQKYKKVLAARDACCAGVLDAL